MEEFQNKVDRCLNGFIVLKEPLPYPKRVIFNGPATIVFWDNGGGKTVVKCAEGEHYDKRVAIMWAFMKKMYGNSSRVNQMLDDVIDDTEQ